MQKIELTSEQLKTIIKIVDSGCVYYPNITEKCDEVGLPEWVAMLIATAMDEGLPW